LRRMLDRHFDVHITMIKEVMTKSFKIVSADSLAVDALTLMQTHKITALLVLDAEETLIGVLHMHDLLRARVV